MNVRGFTLVETMVALMISAIIITLAWDGFSSLKRTIEQLWETRTTVLAQQETLTRIEADVAIGIAKTTENSSSTLTIALPGNGSIISYQIKPSIGQVKESLLRSGSKRNESLPTLAANIDIQMPSGIAHQPFGKTNIWTTIPSEQSPFELEFQGITPAAEVWRQDPINSKIDSYAPEN